MGKKYGETFPEPRLFHFCDRCDLLREQLSQSQMLSRTEALQFLSLPYIQGQVPVVLAGFELGLPLSVHFGGVNGKWVKKTKSHISYLIALKTHRIRTTTNTKFYVRRASDFEMVVLAANRIDHKILIDVVPTFSPYNRLGLILSRSC